MKWIKTEDELPPEGKYVLARHNRGTWFSITDQDNVNCVVVRLKRGISIEERKTMSESSLGEEIKRSMIYKEADEHWNNQKSYCWNTFGATSFFGQEITHWTTIEPV